MAIYYGLLLFIVASFVIQKKYSVKLRKKRVDREIFIFVAWLLLSSVAGFRAYRVGTDTLTYVAIYNNKSDDMEIGFSWLIQLLHELALKPTAFLFACALITNGLVLIAISRLSDNVWLSVYLYITLYYYFNSFNAMRQYIAVSILLNAFYYASKKRWGPYSVLLIIAISFHSSALIGIVFVLIFGYGSIDQNKKTKFILIGTL